MSHATAKKREGPHRSREEKRRVKRRSSSGGDAQTIRPTGWMRVLSGIWTLGFYVIMIGILLGAVLFKLDNSPTKSLYGYHFMTVKTDSMAPRKAKPTLTDGFPAGSFIIVKKVDPNELKVGDIITFFPVPDNTSAYLTHRIIDMETPLDTGDGEAKTGITTQGDANDGPDFPIEKSAVVGKVIWHAKGGGTFIDFVRDKYGVIALLIGVLFVFTLTLKYYLSIPTVAPRRRKRVSQS